MRTGVRRLLLRYGGERRRWTDQGRFENLSWSSSLAIVSDERAYPLRDRATSMSNAAGWDHHWEFGETAWFESSLFIDDVQETFSEISPIRPPLLDVGCGRGRFSAAVLRRFGGPVTGVDVSRYSLRSFAGHCAVADSCDLPFGDHVFQSVAAILVLEHLPDYRRFLREAARVLRPGGDLFLLFPNRRSAVTPALWVQRHLLRRRSIPYHRPLTAPEVSQAGHEVGLSTLGIRYMSIGAYRGRLDRYVSKAVSAFASDRFREEIVMVLRNAATDLRRRS